jgi:hypothetical protein
MTATGCSSAARTVDLVRNVIGISILGNQSTHSGLAEKLQQFRASVEGANAKQAQYQKRPGGERQRGFGEIFELRSPH